RYPRPQANGMAPPEKVQPAGVKGNSRTDAGCARRQVRALAAANPRNFGAETAVKRVASGFFDVVDDIFSLQLPIRILNRHINFGEDSEVVESPLRVGHLNGRERVARREQQVMLYQLRPRGFETLHNHIANELPLPLHDDKAKVHLLRLEPWLRTPLETGVRKAVGKVHGQNPVAVRSHVEFAERLAL